jgi:hypothetical protein
MADMKISGLTALTGANTATGDLLEIVDVSDTTMAATGTNKKITRDEMKTALLVAPGPIGGTTPGAGTFTTLTSTGNVGIGGAAVGAKLHVSGSGTDIPVLISSTGSSANSNGVRVYPIIASTSTNSHKQFQSIAETSASAFTLSGLTHYEAFQGTIGATSAVTTQYGFVAQSNLTGATNNYGFYSNIAAAANRYNFYAAGTADNYFAGHLGVGAIFSDYKLNVHATIANAARFYQATSATNTDVYIDNVDVTGNFLISRRAAGESWFYNSAAQPIALYTNGIDRFRVAASTYTATVGNAVAIPAGGTAGFGYCATSTANFGVFFGSGAPTLSAAKGSLYLRSDGSTTNDRMYVNTNGGTTWTAVTTAA